jgi:cyclopropane fatty-acyl-phospholipid synthase-like methyltransferase
MSMRIPSRLRVATRILLHGEPQPTKPAARSWFQRAGNEIDARGLFVGCQLEVFEYTAKDLFCLALMEGLSPSAAVLEVGCGCLRTGYWFVQYLDAERYCGIEPNARMLDAGRELILGRLESQKSPQFSNNDDFDFGVFGKTFDFVVAFSIWSHASKGQIGTMLDQFGRTANPAGKFLTSWVPASKEKPDYEGTSWVGRSHRSDQPGIVAHSRSWVTDAVAARGFSVRFVEGFATLGQNWLVVSRQ